MANPDPRVGEYIDRSADIARPILRKLREAVHGACPDAVETPKWKVPAFLCRGRIMH